MEAIDKANGRTMGQTATTPSVVQPDDVHLVSVMGVQVDILLTGAQTGGAFSMYRMVVAQGAGAPPHVHHKDDEAFTVVSGTIECGCGDRVLTLGPGATVSLPRDIPHYFRGVGETPAVVYGVASPAGHDQFFEDASRLSFPPDMAEVIAVCARHGMEILPPAA